MNNLDEDNLHMCEQCSVSSDVAILYPVLLPWISFNVILCHKCLVEQLMSYRNGKNKGIIK